MQIWGYHGGKVRGSSGTTVVSKACGAAVNPTRCGGWNGVNEWCE